MKTVEQQHEEMVTALVKSPTVIKEQLTTLQCDMIHAVLGLSGEVGELVDAIKKNAIYQKPLDYINVVEELGDLEFYLEQLRQALGIKREETLRQNINKLSERYRQFKYSDQAAQERADKA